MPIDTREDYDGIIDTDGCHDSPSDDWDGDGLTDEAEVAQSLDPQNPDTDGDGVLDGVDNCPSAYNPGQKASYAGPRPAGSQIPGGWASNPANHPQGDACDPDTPPNPYGPCTDPIDTDGDGFSDCIEHKYHTCAEAGDPAVHYSTCATPTESDGDACADWIEIDDVNGDRVANILDVQWVGKRVFNVIPSSDSDAVLDIDKNWALNILDVWMAAKNSSLLRPHSPCTPEG